MRLADLLDVALLEELLAAGLVRSSTSADGLTIFDYTKRAQATRAWNPVTTVCRGLVVDRDGTVVARPLPRFGDVRDLDEVPGPFDASEKVDGSLVIHVGDGRFATRGSFTSQQALHAADIWADRYHALEVPSGETWCFEVVYPDNRIVVDNGDIDDLFLLAAIDVETGAEVEATTWPGPRPRTWSAITDLPDLGPGLREGFVLRLPDGTRWKAKTASYEAAHRLLESATEREVWEGLRAGSPLSERAAAAGVDHLAAWAVEVEGRLTAVFENVVRTAAEEAAESPDRASISGASYPDVSFAIADGKHPDARAWRYVRPEPTPFPGAGRR